MTGQTLPSLSQCCHTSHQNKLYWAATHMFGGCDQPNILCCNVLMLICLFPYYLTKKTLCLRQGQKRFLWNSLPCPANLHQEEKRSALKRRQRAPLPRLSLQHTSPHLSFLNHYNVTYKLTVCALCSHQYLSGRPRSSTCLRCFPSAVCPRLAVPFLLPKETWRKLCALS